MKIIIIEDEELAAEGLIMSLKKAEKDCEVLAVLDSVKTAVEWFKSNPAPDLAFFDIQLADGVSFEIFEKTAVKCPVIFTTAYDEYALKAFKVNSIDYLLKPISVSDLSKAFEKWRLLQGTTFSPTFDETAMRQMMQMMTQRIASPPPTKPVLWSKSVNICKQFKQKTLIFCLAKIKAFGSIIKMDANTSLIIPSTNWTNCLNQSVFLGSIVNLSLLFQASKMLLLTPTVV